MAVIEVQAVEFVVTGEPQTKGRKAAAPKTCYDGFIKWRTESGSAATGRNMIKAWLNVALDEIDITDDVLSGKVSYRAA